MKLWRRLVLLLMLLTSSSTWAYTTYQWEPVSSSPTIAGTSGTLEIDESIVAAGNVFLTYDGYTRPGPTGLNFLFSAQVPNRFGSLWTTVIPAGERFGASGYNMVLDFTDPEFLRGHINVHCWLCDTDVIMGSGAGTLWNVLGVFSNACSLIDHNPCTGATGHWRKVENGHVPEPPALLLLGIGLITLISSRRCTFLGPGCRAPGWR